MAILDIFKKKKPTETSVKPIEKPKTTTRPRTGAPDTREALAGRPHPPAKLSPEIPSEKPVEIKPKARKEKISRETYRILKAPQITEKVTTLVGKNQYTFKIWPRTNKMKIKKAIEDLYGVDVLSVKIIKVPKKPRRLGKQRGYKSGYKKAIVKIKKGQKIEVLPR